MSFPIMVYVSIIASHDVQKMFFKVVNRGIKGHGKVVENMEGIKGFNLRLPYDSKETLDGTTYLTYFANTNPPEEIKINPIIQKAFVIIEDGTPLKLEKWKEYIEKVKESPGKAFGEPYVLCFTLIEGKHDCKRIEEINEDTIERMFFDLHNLVHAQR
ncbi:MAG: hypothetical protein D6732_10660 [Methanobacteriota archaeon]|nr:MAG: hypothetical protein D6732_10660 [Euryarchaeota archaeon]